MIEPEPSPEEREESAAKFEAEHIRAWEVIEEECFAALARGERTVKIEFGVTRWLAILDEIRDRRPRNYSRLVADDAIARLNQAIDRLHDEANYLIVHGPGKVSDAFPRRREGASPALKRAMRDKGGAP